jgi:hypothetical protein
MGGDEATTIGAQTPSPAPPDGAAPRSMRRTDADPSGLNFSLATDLAQVIDAWGLVYTAYRRLGLIDANPYHIHTTRQAVGARVVVVAGRLGPLTVSTLTVIPDGPAGLPLDSVYGAELSSLRAEGGQLIEVGLLADRREHVARSATALFELMRFAVHYAAHFASDMVIGVHPHHASFYCRGLGFEQAAPPTLYPSVHNKPVILLRFPVARNLALNPPPRILSYILERPVAPEVYAKGFDLDGPEARASVLGEYLRDQVKARGAAPIHNQQDSTLPQGDFGLE